MKKIRKTILNVVYKALDIIPKLIPDILAVSGAVSISYGAFLLLRPLGYVLAGVMLIAAAVILSKSELN